MSLGDSVTQSIRMKFSAHTAPIEYYETSLGLTLKRRRWAETSSDLVRYV
jgi:hypothetical protein